MVGFRKLKSGLEKMVLLATAAIFSFCVANCKPYVDYPPVIESTPITQVNEDEEYKYPVEASDADGDILEYSVIKGEGLYFDSNTLRGSFSDIDSDITVPVKIQVSDGKYNETQEYNLLVKNNSEEEPIEPEPPVNYDPEVDLSSVDADLYEEGTKVIELPLPIDENGEDNPVQYIRATSLDDKVIPTLNGNISEGYQLTVQGNKDETGTYQIELEFGSESGGIGKVTLEGIITDLPDISGQLQDNENDEETSYEGKKGVIKIYRDSEDTNPYYAEVDSSGRFTLQLDELLSEIILQARMLDEEGNPTSYTRTLYLDGTQDLDVGNVRVSAYKNILSQGVSAEDYKQNLEDLNLERWGQFGDYGLKKFDWSKFQGIEIENRNFRGEEYGTFDSELQEHYKEKILNTTDIGKYLQERGIITENIQLDDGGSTRHYDEHENYITPHEGWIVVMPDINLGNGYAALTTSYDPDCDGKSDRVKILIQDPNDPTFTKEMTRAFFYLEGNSSLSDEQTVMVSSSTLESPSSIDYRMAHDIDEETYLPQEKSDDILGLTWLDEQ